MAAARAHLELGSKLQVHSGHRQHETPAHEGARASQKLISGRPGSSASVSPSSLHSITTDSDSIVGEHQQQQQQIHEQQVVSPPGNQRKRSAPILIKYNYYDYNGERQENHDMTQFVGQQQQVNSKSIQRQLSPTFKQSLDQIVRSSQNFIKQQQQQQQQQHSNSSSPTSPTPGGGGHRPNGQHDQCTMSLLARRYKLSSYEHRCLRCGQTVYQMDKVGPLKDFTFYHQNCFKCRECGTKLTLKTYFNNQHSSTDREVYCNRHCPKTPAGKLDNQSVGIRAALNAPKVFDPVHQQAFEPSQLISNSSSSSHHQLLNGKQQPQVDSRALYIQHAVQQTRLQSIYNQSQVDQRISQFLNRRLEFLEPKQRLLEMRHREEEEQLFKVFEQKWCQEESQIRDQIRDEWQRELNKLVEKYKRQLSANFNEMKNGTSAQSNISNSNSASKLAPRIDFHMASSKLMNSKAQSDDIEEQRMIELERLNLEKTMTIKLDRKKETLKRKLREFERQATAELVEKQSREMLTLISLKLEEFKQEQKRKIGSDLEQFEAMESLANQLGASLQVTSGHLKPLAGANGQPVQQRHSPRQPQVANANGNNNNNDMPAPRAAQLTKMDLYNSEQADEVFKEIDAIAINVAKEDQRSFTELVHALTRHCLTDVEKVRAIFRWITVKNLNTMHFDASVKPDTPLGLLRGIKQGSESYHVLFKRLCSYAGLHCVVIKGFSKSAGYQPGVRFEGNRFRNSWNAVFVAGAWRFVQCNWGARHLVSVAVMQDKNSSNSSKSTVPNMGRAGQNQQRSMAKDQLPAGANLGRRGLSGGMNPLAAPPLGPLAPIQASGHYEANGSSNGSAALHKHHHGLLSPTSPVLSTSNSTGSSTYSTSSSGSSACPSPSRHHTHTPLNGHHHHQQHHRLSDQRLHHRHNRKQFLNETAAPTAAGAATTAATVAPANDSLRYEYDDHYFLTDPDEFIYEFFPAAPEWQLLRSRPLTLTEFEQLPFVRSLFFKYGLYFAQPDIKSVLYTNSSGATTVKIGMPTHMIPSLIFHYNLKYFDSEAESHEGVSLKRFVMQSVESVSHSPATGAADSANQMLLSNVVSFRVHVPENGAYILDIFANSTTPTQYITGEPMKFKSVCKFKIIARNLKTVMVPLPDCASGEFGPMKATRLFGIIPLTHESGLISVQNDKRFLEIQFRMSRPLLDFMASLHKNAQDERQLSKLIKIFIEGDCLLIAIKFLEDGQYGLDIYTRDQSALPAPVDETSQLPGNEHHQQRGPAALSEPKKQLLTHCCKYLINVRANSGKRAPIDQ